MRRLPMQNSSPSPKPWAGRAAKIIEGSQDADFGAKRRRFGRRRQKVIQSAIFVTFKVRAANPAGVFRPAGLSVWLPA
jgi:hypothetical protein